MFASAQTLLTARSNYRLHTHKLHAFSALSINCTQTMAFGAGILLLCPILFLAYAWMKVRRHIKSGNLTYKKNDMPNLKQLYNDIIATPGVFGKIVNARAVINSYQERGEWEDDEHSAKWAFLMGDYCGGFWLYSIWLLVKKVILSGILNMLEGQANAVGALILQCMDSGLLLFMRPFVNRQTDLSETIGTVSNLLAYLAISLPVIAPQFVFFGEFAQIASATLSTVVGAFFSMMAPVFAIIKAVGVFFAFLFQVPSRILACYAALGSGGSIFATIQEAAYGNMKDALNDELEDHYALEEEEGEGDGDGEGDGGVRRRPARTVRAIEGGSDGSRAGVARRNPARASRPPGVSRARVAVRGFVVNFEGFGFGRASLVGWSTSRVSAFPRRDQREASSSVAARARVRELMTSPSRKDAAAACMRFTSKGWWTYSWTRDSRASCRSSAASGSVAKRRSSSLPERPKHLSWNASELVAHQEVMSLNPTRWSQVRVRASTRETPWMSTYRRTSSADVKWRPRSSRQRKSSASCTMPSSPPRPGGRWGVARRPAMAPARRGLNDDI